MFVLPQCKQDAVCRRASQDKSRQLQGGKAKKKKMATYRTEENTDGARGSKGLIDDVEGIIGPQTQNGAVMESVQ